MCVPAVLEVECLIKKIVMMLQLNIKEYCYVGPIFEVPGHMEALIVHLKQL